MIFNELGHDTMAAGLHEYLGKHAYANATTSDLWTALSAASGVDVGARMSRWVTVTGYPLLSIKREGTSIVVSQVRARGVESCRRHVVCVTRPAIDT